MPPQSIGIIGYGEVGKIFSAGLKPQVGSGRMGVWDLKLGHSDSASGEQAHARQAGVVAYPSARALCEASELVISAVTASNTLAVAEEAARYIRPGSIFLDFNSASPGTKQRSVCRGGRHDLGPALWHQDADAAGRACSGRAGPCAGRMGDGRDGRQ